MKKNKVSTVLLIGFSVFTLLLVGFIVLMTATHAKAFAVQTDSMSPVLRKGYVVFVRDINATELKTGDIVTVEFNDQSGVFTHRVTGVDSEQGIIITKGDKNLSEDPEPAEFSQIIGKYWFSVPALGYISFVTQSKLFLIALALIAITLVAVGKIFSIKRYKKGGGTIEE